MKRHIQFVGIAAALAGVKWLHVTGITPAISEAACRANLAIVQQAKQQAAQQAAQTGSRIVARSIEVGHETSVAKRCDAASATKKRRSRRLRRLTCVRLP